MMLLGIQGWMLTQLLAIASAQDANAGIPQVEAVVRSSPSIRRAPGSDATSLQLRDETLAKEQRYLIERVDPQQTLDVTMGRPTVMRFRQAPFRDQIGDPEIVDVLNITETEISLTGKTVGSTVLNLWFNRPDRPNEPEVLSYLVRVAEDPEQSRQYDILLENLERDINRGFPNSVVDLSYVGAQVVVRGKAKDIEEATNIVRIVSQSLPTEEQTDQSATMVPAAAQNRAGNNLFQPGAVQSSSFQSVEGFSIDEVVNAGGLDNIFSGNNVTGNNANNINRRIVNMLEIAGVHQVMLKVTLAEVVRDSGRSLISTARFGDDSDTMDDITFSQSTGVGQLTFQTNQFFLQFDALKRLGLARSLSEPNLTTLSGQQANFLVGGQFPILESTSTVAAVNQTIRFVPFGIQLAVMPTVTDGDRIRLQLQSTISETSNGGGAAGGIGGVGGGAGAGGGAAANDPSQPPSLSTRSFTSTVELRDGESMALAGLIRSSMVNSSAKLPFLGDMPLIGNIFANNETSYQEQELLVVVTPYLVSPLGAGATLPVPGSDVFQPDDLDFYLRGAIEGRIAEDYRTPVRGNPQRMKAFRRSEQKYIIGMPGHSSGRPLPVLESPAYVTPRMMTSEVGR